MTLHTNSNKYLIYLFDQKFKFCHLDPDPVPDSQSGSRDLVESGSRQDSNPKHC